MNEEQRSYVRQQLDGGANKEQLRETLLQHNYTDAQIDALFSAYNAEKEAAEPAQAQAAAAPVAQPGPEHVEYVRRQKERGVSDVEITETLRQNGYQDELIHAIFMAIPSTSTGATAPTPHVTPAPAHQTEEAAQVSTAPQTQTQAPSETSNTAVYQTPHTPKLIGYGEMLKEGWSRAISNVGAFGAAFAALLLLGGLMFLLILIVSFAAGATMMMSEGIGLLLYLVGFLALYVLIIGYMQVVLVALLRRLMLVHGKTSYWSQWHYSWKFAFSAFLITVYVQIVSQMGFMLLVIPGIIISIYLAYSIYVLAGEERRGFDALIRSIELVYGRWWSVVGRSLLLVLIVCGALLLLGMIVIVSGEALGFLVYILAVPLLILGAMWVLGTQVVLFESLQKLVPADSFDVSDRSAIKLWLRIAVILAIVLSIASLAFSVVLGLRSVQQNLPAEFLLPDGPGARDGISLPIDRDHQDDEAAGGGDSAQSRAADMLVQQQMVSLRASAVIFSVENENSYSGFCSEAMSEFSALQVCNDDTDSFAATASLSNGDAYCVDGEGFSGTIGSSLSTSTSCEVIAGDGTNGATASEEVTTFTDPDGRYTIRHPANWTQRDVFGATIFVAPEQGNFSKNVNVFTEDVSEQTGLTLDRYLEISLKNVESFITDFTLISSESATVNGTPAQKIRYSGRQGTNALIWEQYVILTAAEAFIVTATVQNEADLTDDIMMAMDSFTLLK